MIKIECHLKDKELVDMCLNNEDSDSIGFLFNSYRMDVVRFINSKINSQELAEDLAQETFIKAYLAIKKYKFNGDNKFKSWLFRIANNLVMDHYRQTARRKFQVEMTDFFLNSSASSDIQIDYEALQSIEVIAEYVTGLTSTLLPEQKEVLDLRLKQNLSFKQIALIQDAKINTVLGRYRYAIHHLKNKVVNMPDFKIQERWLTL
jgi:RNA polymerase sigma-70 factor (ECF subfamily)